MTHNKMQNHTAYIFDKGRRIWIRPDYEGIAYSDGTETERRLKAIVDNTADVSVMSVELVRHCTDWPSTYHFSRKRSNIFRPFQSMLKGKSVLEIGSGCGAISRYLGEAGAEVTALEGSPMRASIGASRCRDLENVMVVSDNFQDFETEELFDVVTLIGVLEYARNFVGGTDPVGNMLAKAKHCLKPTGILIIAIENQLGLKYFAGYLEDHVSKPMYGIEGHYSDDTVITFGKKELGEHVAKVGLIEQTWWFPFPDYKMPSLMVTETGAMAAKDEFDLATLVRGTCANDMQTVDSPTFIQERAWTAIINNQLLGDLSNSFVLLASQQEITQDKQQYACHFATERRPEFAKQVTFQNKNGVVEALQTSLYPATFIDTSNDVKQSLDQKSYILGTSWQDELINIMSTPGWSVEQLSAWFAYWLESLLNYAEAMNKPLEMNGIIAPSLLDALPRNLLKTRDAHFDFIDLEWSYNNEISTRFLIFRALFSSLHSLGVCAEPKAGVPLNLSQLSESVFALNNIKFTDAELNDFMDFECKLQLLVSGGKGLKLSDYQQLEIKVFDTQTPAGYKLAQVNSQLAQCVEANELMVNSSSWKLTKPLRGANRYIPKIKNRLIKRPIAWTGHQRKRIKHVFTLLGDAVRVSGGSFALIGKVIAVFKHQGFAGIKKSVTTFLSSRNNYKQWIQQYEALTEEQIVIMRKNIASMLNPPVISIVMPTYNPDLKWLIEAIESVKTQTYPHWELCIADDASTNPDIRSTLEEYAAQESRIKVVFRENNGHISAASNSALELVKGDWIALMDHDDVLSKDALYWVAEAIVNNSTIRLIYSDECKIDEANKRYHPYFKCDWNPDLFYSQNMFSHLGVFETALVRSIGGFREGLDGSQDYDLVLRCIEQIEGNQIHHIPRVLYFWRAHRESTSQSSKAKPYTSLVGERALNEHFQRIGVDAKAEAVKYGYRIKYSLPEELPLVTLIIPTRNGLDLIRQCIESITQKTRYANYEIIIIDNGSDDPGILGYFEALASDQRIRIHRDERPFNYSQLNNGAVELANGELIGLINNDIEVISPDWLSEMVSHALRPEIGAVGAKLWYPDDTIQHGGVVLGLGGVAGHGHLHYNKGNPGFFGRLALVSNYSAVTAACLVIRKSVYEEVNGLNQKDLKVAFNDVDFCLKVREAGYRNLWTPYAELYHHESATRGYEDTPEKQQRFASEIDYMKSTWGDILLNDPAYSPNLTQDYEDFSYAWPPRVEGIEA
jgi:glycosyltransferase involved in cell wall biosynthesis/2-polyprenyl-3-methyl-5-hydroxy-6-metoxy-1,4-benzoquinol methylase